MGLKVVVTRYGGPEVITVVEQECLRQGLGRSALRCWPQA
jgi:hypothetical protein